MSAEVIDPKSYSRFRFAHESLDSIDINDETHNTDFPFAEELAKRRYPVRALRYWWLNMAIHEEAKRLARPLTIADVGCDRGIIKRFILPVPDSTWIGLDIIVNRPGIEKAGYAKIEQCDFDDPLPLDDASYDIVICSHVLEHLPRPEFTIVELARVLKPGGMMLLGVPTLPKPIAKIRENTFNKELRSGKRVVGQHIHVFWPQRLKDLATNAGLAVEFESGTALIRKKGSILEDHASWIRVNQYWAGLFPSLGMELCLQLRKPD